jgi:hypothetical protein
LHAVVLQPPVLAPLVMSWSDVVCAYGSDAGYDALAALPARAYTPAISGDARLVPPTWNHPDRPWYLVES